MLTVCEDDKVFDNYFFEIKDIYNCLLILFICLYSQDHHFKEGIVNQILVVKCQEDVQHGHTFFGSE